ncbi:MAG: AbiV family abortive infection protein [Ferrovibrionaceae bacterium]
MTRNEPKPLKKPTAKVLLQTIDACIENAGRLIEETYDLEFRQPSSTRYFLAMIAQEEVAKAFLLHLIEQDIAPFDRVMLKAMNDHRCKQLVGLILDYVLLRWETIDELKAEVKRDADAAPLMPNDIGSAIELLVYEKVSRWYRNNWVWGEDPNYDRHALAVAEGRRDRKKQDALYVRVGKDGRASSAPSSITEDETDAELSRAEAYLRLLRRILDGSETSHRYERVIAALKILFSEIRR